MTILTTALRTRLKANEMCIRDSQNTYWIEMGCLAIFLIPSLLLGLVLRKPVIRLNHTFTEKLESTHLM